MRLTNRRTRQPWLGFSMFLLSVTMGWAVVIGLYFLLRWVTLNIAPLLGWNL